MEQKIGVVVAHHAVLPVQVHAVLALLPLVVVVGPATLLLVTIDVDKILGTYVYWPKILKP